MVEVLSANGYKHTYKYNEENKLIDKTKFNKYINGFKLDSKDIYKYDAKGNQVEWAAYNGAGSLYSKMIYKYDDNGNIIEQYYNSPDGKSDYKVFNKYDSNGNMTEQKSYNSNGKLDNLSSYNYNSEGILIASSSGLNYKEYSKYDDMGNQIEYSMGSTRTAYKYEFDKTGNWIKKTEYQNNKPSSVIERGIEYY